MYRDRLLLLAFALSGAAALGYELLWTRLLAVLETIAALYALASPHLLYWLASRPPRVPD